MTEDYVPSNLSSLAQRLRKATTATGMYMVCNEAADAIERLQAQRSELIVSASAKIDELRAENAELNRVASIFYKRVSYRVPGLIEQLEEQAAPLRLALCMDSPSETCARSEP